MPCDTQLSPEQTAAQRRAEIDAAMRELEQQLSRNAVRVVIGPSGALCFAGWGAIDRRKITDACAYRTLTARGSFALKQAVQAAEIASGRKISNASVNAGVHSHDAGRTWSKH